MDNKLPFLLDRKQASDFLGSFGYKVAPRTLAKWACVSNDGPPFRHFGRKVRYERPTLLAWAEGRLRCQSKLGELVSSNLAKLPSSQFPNS